MITVLLLILTYFAFISLGLPDSLLGVSWPMIRQEWNMALDAAGLVALFLTGSTIISAFLSGHIIKKIGTGRVTFISCLMTGLSLLGFSFAPSYVWLLLLAIPLGFGAGSVDTALNNYVALHFKAHHMNWLHSFWGVGATLGPVIMSGVLASGSSWRYGYRYISYIQLMLALLLMVSLPLWKKHASIVTNNDESSLDSSGPTPSTAKQSPFSIPGVKYAFLIFLFYCSVEASVGLWGSTYLINSKGIAIETAAFWVAMYYGGITIGRFLSGFISFKFTNNQMITGGMIIVVIGTLLLLSPIPTHLLLIPLMLIGFGLSPIFPAMIHETPVRFGKEFSQIIIGYQMGFAYVGIATLPPLLGIAARKFSTDLIPYFWVIATILMVINYILLMKLLKKNKTISV